MDFAEKRIGIWGYGITGRSIADFALKRGARVSVMDSKELKNEQDYFTQHAISFFPQNQMEAFFASNDLIIPSAGIDLRPYYETHKNKWLFELDIFAAEYKKPYIAITGSVGKTTITSLLSQLLVRYGKKIATGGNIGIASLDLLASQNDIDLAVIEVSSFQLEHATHFAPEIALITNIIENHLDRHGSMEEYIKAKFNIANNVRHVLLPPQLATHLNPVHTQEIHYLPTSHPLLPHLPPITFQENWLTIIAALDTLGLPLSELPKHAQHLIMPEHRTEYVATINGAHYYNDSKSTSPAATLAAVELFKEKPIHLLLGGLSKGINREPLICQLRNKVKTIYCFGKEADMLYELATKYNIPACSNPTLEAALTQSKTHARSDEIILLSPAGSSYDLFDNFEHRGRMFKQLIKLMGDN